MNCASFTRPSAGRGVQPPEATGGAPSAGGAYEDMNGGKGRVWGGSLSLFLCVSVCVCVCVCVCECVRVRVYVSV